MKIPKFSPFRVMHGAALNSALSVAASFMVAAALAAPAPAFATVHAAHPTAHGKAKTKTIHTKAEPKARHGVRHEAEAKPVHGRHAAKVAAGADRHREVAETSRHHHGATRRVSLRLDPHARRGAVRRVTFEPARPVQAFGLHEMPDGGVALRSSVAYVIDQNTLQPLYDKNSRAVMPIASITKLMTAMVVLDSKLPMTEQIEVTDADRDYVKNTGSRLSVGSVLSREDMLHIALMASENRAAAALSRYYPGGRPAFIAAMNAKAKQLGMLDTHFISPSGLTSENVSSARDLAKMVNAAYKYPLIREFSTDHSYDVFTGKKTIHYASTNALVRNRSWDIGLQKTGFINEAGECLVMQAVIDSRPVIMVLLDSTGKYSRFADAQRLRTWLDTGGVQRVTSADTGRSGT